MKTAHQQPKYWGLHNYADANQYKPRATKALLKAVKGKIWLTETGGVVRRRNGSSVKYTGESLTHAAKAINYIFTKLVRLSPRIQRVYVFHWNGRNALVGLGADLAQRQRAPRVRRFGERAASPCAAEANRPRQHPRPLLPSQAIPWTGEVRLMNAMRFHITTTKPVSRLVRGCRRSCPHAHRARVLGPHSRVRGRRRPSPGSLR